MNVNGHILVVEQIHKRFLTVTAVDGLSFSIRRGEIFGLLGPNGAGKTTTVRMLLRIIRPDEGEIRYHLHGASPAIPLPGNVGYLPEDRGLYKEIPILKTLVYMGILRGMDRRSAATAANEWLERVGLAERSKEKLDALSKGNQQKVQFISAILHRPDFAILDEPFSGLDPVNQEFFLGIIRELRDAGMTILLCAHQMNLVERLADRVLLMNRGKEVLAGSIAEIKNMAGGMKKIILGVADQRRASEDLLFEGVDHVAILPDGEIEFTLRKEEPVGRFLAAAAARLNIVDIRTASPDLHDIFIRTVGAPADGKAGGRE
jgi:ABC-2 type transport system ATP-binding protein